MTEMLGMHTVSHQCLYTGIRTERLGSNAGCLEVAPEVNLSNSLHIDVDVPKRGIHPVFETQDRCHQKSKTGVSVAPKIELMSTKKKQPANS